jgi:hypothetical protein
MHSFIRLVANGGSDYIWEKVEKGGKEGVMGEEELRHGIFFYSYSVFDDVVVFELEWIVLAR